MANLLEGNVAGLSVENTRVHPDCETLTFVFVQAEVKHYAGMQGAEEYLVERY